MDYSVESAKFEWNINYWVDAEAKRWEKLEIRWYIESKLLQHYWEDNPNAVSSTGNSTQTAKNSNCIITIKPQTVIKYTVPPKETTLNPKVGGKLFCRSEI